MAPASMGQGRWWAWTGAGASAMISRQEGVCVSESLTQVDGVRFPGRGNTRADAACSGTMSSSLWTSQQRCSGGPGMEAKTARGGSRGGAGARDKMVNVADGPCHLLPHRHHLQGEAGRPSCQGDEWGRRPPRVRTPGHTCTCAGPRGCHWARSCWVTPAWPQNWEAGMHYSRTRDPLVWAWSRTTGCLSETASSTPLRFHPGLWAWLRGGRGDRLRTDGLTEPIDAGASPNAGAFTQRG